MTFLQSFVLWGLPLLLAPIIIHLVNRMRHRTVHWAATDTSADLPGMLQTALKWLVDTRSGAAEIWIASDLQESDWAPEDGRWKSTLDQFRALPQKVRFRILSFESAGEANASVSLA